MGDNEGETLMFAEFMIALALCGNIKYANVEKDGEPLELALRCEGIMCNFLQTKDESKVITDALFPPLVRYDYENSGADAGFIDTYSKMDLSALFGFPLWEEVRARARARLCVLLAARHASPANRAALAPLER